MAMAERFTSSDEMSKVPLDLRPTPTGEPAPSRARTLDSATTARLREHRGEDRAPVLAPRSPDTNAAVRGVPALGARPLAPAPTTEPHTGLVAWTRRYTQIQAGCDALVGVLAVLAALLAHDFPFSWLKVAVLLLGAGAAWPVAIAMSRGYERSNIGVGDDELRSVMRAGVCAVALGAFPTAISHSLGVVAVSVIAVPLAVLGSMLVRLATRRHLHRQQRAGRNVRRVVVVGSAYAAADLASALTRESQCGMTVIGACVPRADLDRAQHAGLAVLGDLDEVPELIRTHGADAVAVTGSDATRHNYLRELSWALEGVGVELLVHPGLVEVAGPRMHIRPHVGLPLLHVEQPHFTGWRRFVKRAADLVLTSLGLLVISPMLAPGAGGQARGRRPGHLPADAGGSGRLHLHHAQVPFDACGRRIPSG